MQNGKIQIELNDIEIQAIRNALTEYYHTVSKPALKKGGCSPYALKLHQAVKRLRGVIIH